MAEARGMWCVPCLASLEILQELCRTEELTCAALGIGRGELTEYEVEYLCGFKKEKGTAYYLVKWKGWPESTNTWEPRRHLHCLGLIKQFQEDQRAFHVQVKAARKVKLNHCRARDQGMAFTEYVVRKSMHRLALKCWEEQLNRKKNHQGKILVENEVDFEPPPLDFHYINQYLPSRGINLTREPLVGCECSDCLVEKCCPEEAGAKFAYNAERKLRIAPGKPIFECNSCCRCGPLCPNRVVQKGTLYDLCIFRTSNGRGWGIKTLQKIKKNRFVMEYVGEVITSEEAERRGRFYDSKGITYLFDLDYVEDEYTVDAARYGNISHFVNHSCDPNLQVYNVFIDSLDTRLPRIALFSTRSIKIGEELTFDYQMKGSGDVSITETSETNGPSKKQRRMECKCGSASCRGYMN
ncbi:histone-lysine N-methyltransferase SUV39H2 [Amblyraja radiata]|uniref:histone-lysine N-methyltransferase SUV39H2 n=1 Tax=Amblyraja radiata TaxID=386614 RepID=UPI0014034B1F|nr:histone-lysine N-methyltransferase SUV39H2 [Amblyraja radiata]